MRLRNQKKKEELNTYLIFEKKFSKKMILLCDFFQIENMKNCIKIS